jgi:Host cell surface-exposed lipoprotein
VRVDQPTADRAVASMNDREVTVQVIDADGRLLFIGRPSDDTEYVRIERTEGQPAVLVARVSDMGASFVNILKGGTMKRLSLAVAALFALLALAACTSQAVQRSGSPITTKAPATVALPSEKPCNGSFIPVTETCPSKVSSTHATPKPPKPKPKPPPTVPEFTTSQEQAIGAAQDYLQMQGFSRDGLIDQLSSQYGDGFSRADATFAVDHITVNWNQQAVRAAQSYLEMQHFSRQGLIDQLSSQYGDQFTVAQATYAADHVGL